MLKRSFNYDPSGAALYRIPDEEVTLLSGAVGANGACRNTRGRSSRGILPCIRLASHGRPRPSITVGVLPDQHNVVRQAEQRWAIKETFKALGPLL